MTTPTLPTQEQIAARLTDRQDSDVFGFETTDYLDYLEFDAAKPFLKEGVTAAEWEEVGHNLDRAKLLGHMERYMDFAWDKAKNCRGLSAARSISHYIAWTWLVGDVELSKELEEDYEFYGKDHLVKVCKHYGWDPERWDDHVRVNSESEL